MSGKAWSEERRKRFAATIAARKKRGESPSGIKPEKKANGKVARVKKVGHGYNPSLDRLFDCAMKHDELNTAKAILEEMRK